MIRHAIAHRALQSLGRTKTDLRFPPLVGSCAFLVTATLTLPVEVLVAVSVLMRPYRWIAIGLSAALGITLASVALYMAFHHVGWNLVLGWYPDIENSKAWSDATSWLSQYGSSSLLVHMAFPLAVPKVPALPFAGIYRLPISELLLAIGLGKALKYNVDARRVSLSRALRRALPRRWQHPARQRFRPALTSEA
jgi:membrane protein YqaA with SNARE-associated domain